MSISEFAFSVDDFQNPKVFKNSEAINTLLVRLLLLEPGTYQSHPDMGVGLISKYRFSTEDDVPDLQSDFQRQIDKYLPQLQGIKISVTLKDSKFIITAEYQEVLYGVSFDQTTTEIITNTASLADL